MTSCELIPAKDVKAQNLVFGRFVITFLGNPYETSATSCVMKKNNVYFDQENSKHVPRLLQSAKLFSCTTSKIAIKTK